MLHLYRHGIDEVYTYLLKYCEQNCGIGRKYLINTATLHCKKQIRRDLAGKHSFGNFGYPGVEINFPLVCRTIGPETSPVRHRSHWSGRHV